MSKQSVDTINYTKDKWYQVYGYNKLWCNNKIMRQHIHKIKEQQTS